MPGEIGGGPSPSEMKPNRPQQEVQESSIVGRGKKLGMGALALLTVEYLLTGCTSSGTDNARIDKLGAERELYSLVKFGEGISASEAMKKAINTYRGTSEGGAYSEYNATSPCPEIDIAVITPDGVFATDGWEGMYKRVDDGDDATLVSDELNAAFPSEGKVIVVDDFHNIPTTIKDYVGGYANPDNVAFSPVGGQSVTGTDALQALGIE